MKKIDDYCSANGLSKWQFGVRAGGTFHLYDRIASGMVNMRTVQKVEAFLEATKTKPKKAGTSKK